MGLVNPVYWLHLASPSRSKFLFFSSGSSSWTAPASLASSTLFRIARARLAVDRVFELEPGRLVDLLQVVSFFADLLNSPLRQAEVVDTRTEHSEHPEASSLFLSGDCAQGPAGAGRPRP